jgi:hypothetical protein
MADAAHAQRLVAGGEAQQKRGAFYEAVRSYKAAIEADADSAPAVVSPTAARSRTRSTFSSASSDRFSAWRLNAHSQHAFAPASPWPAKACSSCLTMRHIRSSSGPRASRARSDSASPFQTSSTPGSRWMDAAYLATASR